MNLIIFLLRSSWKIVAIAIVTGFLSGSSSASLIALISNATTQNQGASLTLLAWGFVGLALISLVTSIISQVSLIRLSQQAVFQLRMRLCQQILASELSHLEQMGTPRLLATLTEDVQAVANAVYTVPFLCIDIAIVIGCLIYITWLSWQVIILVIILAVVAISSCEWITKQGSKNLAFAREDEDILFKHFRTITEGIKELKLHYQRRESFITKQLQVTANIYKQHYTRGLTFFATTNTWGRLIFFFSIGFVLFALPKFITFNLQTLYGYILTFTYLMMPMDNIISKLPLLSQAAIGLEKIESLGLSLASRAENSTVPPNIKSSWQRLEIKQVTHTYHTEQEDGKFKIGPINLTLYPQELVFIVGGNGSGKSSLAKLITGLYIPESGEICFDGKLITDDNREWYRQHFSVVFADFYLFDELFGLEDKNSNLDKQAQKYLKVLQLQDKVTIENGVLSNISLSQGQRKRLALLTAYLEDRPIYLFDEWAADQDPAFKELFYTKLLPELRDKGKTILAITHDDRYFHVADRIIKLDYGKIESETSQ
ncbi:cyclic peptide export ABC transporter [Brunnivagina elsteri]|uniref:ABC transporter ATP-binding protein n=1 Tax=Brunnivagina elsteri CCALA 953 TaxID=987040 RepID=A0A2A2TN24_9CYAN|nr:cyclic peptide export ABC transporter [Calothrix elsteri]PAX59889.1 ABC transporter ATP-binding protein [Calothrix elsteri CCALA 953]